MSTNPAVTLLFTQQAYTVFEGQPTVEVCLELSGAGSATQTEIWATFLTAEISATGKYACMVG